MRGVVFLLGLLALSACGADGEPEPRETGVSVAGEVRIGVTGSL